MSTHSPPLALAHTGPPVHSCPSSQRDPSPKSLVKSLAIIVIKGGHILFEVRQTQKEWRKRETADYALHRDCPSLTAYYLLPASAHIQTEIA